VSDLAVFGYGSLASPASVSGTLGRGLEVIGQARLEGWRRRWSVMRDNRTSEKAFARALDGSIPAHCIGLNLEPTSGAPAPNGVLLRASEADLDRLDLREVRYERADVTRDVRMTTGNCPDTVVTYVARAGNFAPDPPEDAIVIASYLEAVEAAFRALGPDALDEFWASTDRPPVEVAEAVLIEDRIPAGNPREW
jgi:cation transport regulator ChaC